MIGAKGSSNIDNVILRPFNMLLVRHEVDNNLIYLSRSSILDYCTQQRVSFKKIETALEESGVLVSRNVQKVLGADTHQYAKGQTRAWKIDATKLVLSTLPHVIGARIGVIK